MSSFSARATNTMLIFGHISNTKKRKAQPVIEISSDSSDGYIFQIQAVLLRLYVLLQRDLKGSGHAF